MKVDDIVSNANLNNREHENAIRTLFRHPNFPCMMSIDGSIANNPIYHNNNSESNLIERIRRDFGPDGTKNFRIMPLDLYLIKGLDKNKQSMLLFYCSGKLMSGWKTFLMPFGDSTIEDDIDKLIKNHERDLEQFLKRESDTISITKLPNNKYLVSFKMDPGYKELVAYVFTFCYVNITGDNPDISKREFEFEYPKYTRKFKWLYPEELEFEEKMMEVNSDVIRYIHNTFETMLNDVPVSLNELIKFFKHDFALSFAGEDRPTVERIARLLRSYNAEVFFDDFYKSDLVGKDLSDYFKKTYGNDTRFVVIFISENYPNKDWANFEFSIARDEAKSRRSEFILPVRLDETKVYGLSDKIGHIPFEKEGISGTVDILMKKLS